MMEDIIILRHELHRYPELSNKEYVTSERINKFIRRLAPDEIIELGSTGKAFVFDSYQPGKTIVFRAELDALPIIENNNFDYASQNMGIAHLCGHDGHMAILAGLAGKIAENRPQKGKVVLLFQPAEEVEQGAHDVVESKEFQNLNPDYVFALHNIPGKEKHKILLKKGSFAASSRGMTIILKGKTSHAAEPEKGISPVNAISLIINELNALSLDKELFQDVCFSTIIHIRLGEISFGTSPGYAEIRITLRAFENNDMFILVKEIEKNIAKIANDEKLKYEIDYSEIFPSTVNNENCVDIIKNAAEENQFEIGFLEKPFKWSEDFGYYTEKYAGGFFGLGSGPEQPALHNPDYDFPDDIIQTGVNMFYSIYRNLNIKR